MSEQTKIVVVGANGRMGRTICGLVEEDPNFRLAGAVDVKDAFPGLAGLDCPVSDSVADILARVSGAVVVDFSAPAVALRSAEAAVASNTPLVVGATGFSQGQRDGLAGFANETPILCSANMSVGINALAALLPELAKTLGPAYDIEMAEIHHRKKKDSPSGTALMLADALAEARGWKLDEARVSCRDGLTGERQDREIGVQALRGGDVVGIHTTYFLGPGEIIEVTHQAESRLNFAQGALRAAVWLRDKPAGRLYSMRDVIMESH